MIKLHFLNNEFSHILKNPGKSLDARSKRRHFNFRLKAEIILIKLKVKFIILVVKTILLIIFKI